MNKFLKIILFSIGTLSLLPLFGMFLFGAAYVFGGTLGNDQSINMNEPISYMLAGGAGIFIVLMGLYELSKTKGK
ncbi:hypothetical protein EMA8858_04184 [Emticicia aquatica]|uniref:Uncharacterized protein n=1 Tax=Emticicia aquatica TaxID=1681835 RepID=A0ABM9AWB8_9BACT|nr:alkaline shock response membrane anchor protein AmaP [Emticicia aquatica]CAH0998049.1 hypothetical protein EMA8858_04184 [Emticicia aquatica]